MRNDRIFKMTRGLSVVASSSLLLLSVAGAASAHPGTANGRVLADGDALRARIMSMEPDLDENEVDELVEAVQEAMDEAENDDDAGGEDAAEDHDQPEALGDRSSDVREAEDEDDDDRAESDDSHHDSDADENDDDEDENDDGDHGDGGSDHESGDHGDDGSDHESGDD